MMPPITTGKQRGLQAVSDSRGVIAALALDQRSALRALFARCMGVEPREVPSEKLIEFKEIVTHVLTPHASAILLDPEYGLPAARRRARNAGLLLAYEKTGYDKEIPGRLPHLLESWSVKRLVEAGADCVKILLYYSSLSSAEINEVKHAFVAGVGAECAASDVPFFLELVSYAEGLDDHGIDFARLKPQLVAQGMAEFSNPRYRVDVLKVGFPVNLAYVGGSPAAHDEILYTRGEAKAHFLSAAAQSRVPFIYLSEGVSNDTFLFGLELAVQAGVRFAGVLCGRATWKDGVPVFVQEGKAALEEWLGLTGIQNIENVNERLAAAKPWCGDRPVSAVD